MGAVLLDYALCDRLEGRPPPQLADRVHEVGVEGQSQTAAATKAVPLLHGEAVNLPSTKLPGNSTQLGFHRCRGLALISWRSTMALNTIT